MEYIIYARYTFWGKTGIDFTNWFIYKRGFNTEQEANESLKGIKQSTKFIDNKTKQKHEYEIRYVDETLLPQPRLVRPKGRPKKVDEKILIDYAKKLLKNNSSIIIDEQIARYVYNDEEMKSIINNYVETKTTNKFVRFWYDNDNNVYLLLKDK